MGYVSGNKGKGAARVQEVQDKEKKNSHFNCMELKNAHLGCNSVQVTE